LKHKNYLLDLELREDIDDYLTLVYALEQGFDVHAVSIHNPSINELNVLKNTLSLFKSRALVVVAGDITEYGNGKDIGTSLVKLANSADGIEHISLPEYKAILETKLDAGDDAPTVFCGGSLHTLSNLLKHFPNTHWDACRQGGYAGPSLVGEKNVLKKFRKREQVPTWNLNLELKATDAVIASKNLSAHFISKNVCHGAWVDKKDISSSDTLFNRVLNDYFESSKYNDKCMHDLLAFMTLSDSELVEFKPVTLSHTDEERPKWSSTFNAASNTLISVAFDKRRFSEKIKNYR
jgi:inosine-uridine nucleoside N-ribohydrolase